MKISIVGAAILFFLSTNVFAVLANTSTWAVPKNLHVYNEDGQTYVDHVQGECSQIRYRLDPSHTKYDAIVSIILAAQMSKRKVLLRYNHSAGCSQGKIVGVYIE